uniref:Sodium/hydrogen exchanger 6-like n=1 Tax=Rhizophora mucronata TaxID=61149 RepID=A0A2P2M8K3_RHIMU
MGGRRNRKKNSSWKLNHALMLVSVSEMLARPPTVKPIRREALASGR